MSYIIRSNAVFDSVHEQPYPAAIRINGEHIAEIMTIEESKKEKYQNIPVEDYGDRLVMPSFIDAHTHMFSGAISVSGFVCNTLGRCHSEEECVEEICKFAAEHSDLKRIRGIGWFLGNWKKDKLPSKQSLDAVIADRPVYLVCADNHSIWLNSQAIKEAGIVPVENLTNGIIETDENGELTGMLIEPEAYAPAMKKYLEFTKEEMTEIHEAFQDYAAGYGIAAVSEMFADDYTEETYQQYEILKEVDENKGLKTHVYAYTKMFGYTDYQDFFQMRRHVRSKHFHIAGVKGFLDGVTETYTGMLLEPYADKPETCGDHLPLWPKEKMQKEIIAANKAGIQVRLHCIADGSVRMALDLYERSLEITGKSDFCNTIEHIENIHPDDIERFKQIGVIPSMQPYHVTLSNCDKVNRLGKERCKYEWPIRTIYEQCGELAIGTDFPVVGLNPFDTIFAALTRTDENGVPMCQNTWEKLELNDILKAYTFGAAKAYREEERMGTLEVGKLADIIVIDRNLFSCSPREILDAKVIANYFEGIKLF